ncbi:YlxR family protein [Rothia koreensis]|uniref:YlxR family protein n=1 Tax=Rothia koreensis TaxID=592378 RepID=UPI003083F177
MCGHPHRQRCVSANLWGKHAIGGYTGLRSSIALDARYEHEWSEGDEILSSPPGIRTCIGCRRSDDRTALVRVVLQRAQGNRTGEIVLDRNRSMKGRGAWLHPDRQCLDRALGTKAFARSFRCPVDPKPLERQWAAEEDSVPQRCDPREGRPLAQSTGASAPEESE